MFAKCNDHVKWTHLMKASEYAKKKPAPGFFSRLFGKTVTSHALGIVFGSGSVATLAEEINAAKVAIMTWAAEREHKDFVLVTAYAPKAVRDEILEKMTKLCSEDAEVAPLLKDIPIEFSLHDYSVPS
jgi:hypothetical protein